MRILAVGTVGGKKQNGRAAISFQYLHWAEIEKASSVAGEEQSQACPLEAFLL